LAKPETNTGPCSEPVASGAPVAPKPAGEAGLVAPKRGGDGGRRSKTASVGSRNGFRSRSTAYRESLRLRPIEVDARKQMIASVAAPVVAPEDCLSIRFGLDRWEQAYAERRHVLDAVESAGYQLERVEQFEVRRTRNSAGVAHGNHSLRACERKPVIDLQRRRSALDQPFRMTPRFPCIARDHRVCGVRGVSP
jgi:hypothetical protein